METNIAEQVWIIGPDLLSDHHIKRKRHFSEIPQKLSQVHAERRRTNTHNPLVVDCNDSGLSRGHASSDALGDGTIKMLD